MFSKATSDRNVRTKLAFAAIAWAIMDCHCLSVWAVEPLDYKIEFTKASSGYDRKTCWVHARAGTIPPKSPENAAKMPLVVMTTRKLQLTYPWSIQLENG